MKQLACTLFLLMAFDIVEAQSTNNVTEATISTFSVGPKRTAEILSQLARQAHIVIGLTGELVGSDDTLISISSTKISMKDLLDEICAKDPRYKWKARDGYINISVGNKSLALVDLVIGNIKIGPTKSPDLMMLIAKQSEVRDWSANSGCNILQVVAGSTGDTWDLNVNVTVTPLWKILNDISVHNGTYFWSALEFSTNPCTINLVP